MLAVSVEFQQQTEHRHRLVDKHFVEQPNNLRLAQPLVQFLSHLFYSLCMYLDWLLYLMMIFP